MPGADLPDLPTPRHPGGREQQPVWDLIEEALSKAPAVVRREGGYDENDWFYVLVAALQIIIVTRERDTARDTSATPNPARQQALAYADHYMHMRADAFNLGPDSRDMLRNAVHNYDLLKVRGLAFRTGSGQVSPATDVSVFWGMQGIEDGFEDRKRHTPTSHNREAASDVMRFVFQATLLTAQVLFRIP